MSPRAAARLESIGFGNVYDYVAGKADWGSADLPLEGALGPRAGAFARSDVPTCLLDDRLQDVQRSVREAGWDMCIVVYEQDVVLGRLGRGALAREDDASVEEAMSPGPATVQPSIPLEVITTRMQEKRLTSYLITTSDGRLVGLLRMVDAERELAMLVNKT